MSSSLAAQLRARLDTDDRAVPVYWDGTRYYRLPAGANGQEVWSLERWTSYEGAMSCADSAPRVGRSAVEYLSNLNAAIEYVGSRSHGDVYDLVDELNKAFVVTTGPLGVYEMLRDGTSTCDTYMCVKKYGLSLAVFVTDEGRRDWTVIRDDDEMSECLDIEPVQAIAYMLARYW